MSLGATGADYSNCTRRGFVAGGAAGGAALLFPGGAALAPALAAGPPKRALSKPLAPGFRPCAVALADDGREVWVTNGAGTTITALRGRRLVRGKTIDVEGAPRDLAISETSDLAVLTTASYDRPGVRIVDLGRRRVKTLTGPEDPQFVAIAGNGRRAFLTDGGRKGTVVPVRLGRPTLGRPVPVGRDPRGIALTPDGSTALVALGPSGRVAIVDLDRGRVVKRIAVAPFPYRIAISPSGRTAVVTHSGFGADEISVLDLRKQRAVRRITVGPDPCAVAFAGETAVVVTNYGGRSVSVVRLRRGKVRTIEVGHRPRAIAIPERGDRAYVANEFEGNVSLIGLGGGR